MKPFGKPISIPILDGATGEQAGGFCSTKDAVSPEELEALERIRVLRAEAMQIKARLKKETMPEDERASLSARLEILRDEGALWQDRRRKATFDKHVALGHAVLPLDH